MSYGWKGSRPAKGEYNVDKCSQKPAQTGRNGVLSHTEENETRKVVKK